MNDEDKAGTARHTKMMTYKIQDSDLSHALHRHLYSRSA